jgi:hypothetical protein
VGRLDDTELAWRGPKGETGERVSPVAVGSENLGALGSIVWHPSRLTDEHSAARLTGRDGGRWCQLFDTPGWSVVVRRTFPVRTDRTSTLRIASTRRLVAPDSVTVLPGPASHVAT